MPTQPPSDCVATSLIVLGTDATAATRRSNRRKSPAVGHDRDETPVTKW